jgi:hypothetical protein
MMAGALPCVLSTGPVVGPAVPSILALDQSKNEMLNERSSINSALGTMQRK